MVSTYPASETLLLGRFENEQWTFSNSKTNGVSMEWIFKCQPKALSKIIFMIIFWWCRSSLWDNKWIISSLEALEWSQKLSCQPGVIGLTWSTLTCVKLVMVAAHYSCVAQWARRWLPNEDLMGKFKGRLSSSKQQTCAYEEDSVSYEPRETTF